MNGEKQQYYLYKPQVVLPEILNALLLSSVCVCVCVVCVCVCVRERERERLTPSN